MKVDEILIISAIAGIFILSSKGVWEHFNKSPEPPSGNVYNGTIVCSPDRRALVNVCRDERSRLNMTITPAFTGHRQTSINVRCITDVTPIKCTTLDGLPIRIKELEELYTKEQ